MCAGLRKETINLLQVILIKKKEEKFLDDDDTAFSGKIK